MVASGGIIYAADINAIIAATTAKPIMRLVQQANQSLADNTDVPIIFGASSEIVDTSNAHDTVTNNTRFTPTKAGWYTMTGILVVPALATYVNLQVYIRKNGTTILPAPVREGPNATASSRSLEVVVMEQANGTTDYFELLGNQDNTASTAQLTPSNGGSSSCVFEAKYERPL